MATPDFLLTPPPQPLRPDARQHWRLGSDARALLLVTAVLAAFGLAVLASASALLALKEGHAGSYYAVRQGMGLAVGAVLALLIAKVDAERWRAIAWPLLLACAALMLLTVLPGTEGIAPRINGSRRWITLGITLQPAEFTKLAITIWTAMLAVKKGERLRDFRTGLLPFLVVIGGLDLLAILEPDLSMAMAFTLQAGVLLFVAGIRTGHLLLLGAIAIPVLWRQITEMSYVLMRIFSFIGAATAAPQVDYQLRQSLVAVGSGGWTGVGYGRGLQQTGFLPFPYSDFIGSNIGEEWGFLGLCFVALAFGAYGWLGFRIARTARTPFQHLLAVGLTVLTVSTAYLHLGVVIGLLPTTGLTLPLFSFGRSNLLLTLISTGILANIGSTRAFATRETPTDPLAVMRRSSGADDEARFDV